MIQTTTILNIADNTGAKKIMCIKLLGNNNNIGSIGDIFIGVIKSALPNMPVKKSNVVKALIIRTLKPVYRSNSSIISFCENSAILINKDNTPRGTRIFGPIPRELKEKNFSKVVSIAPDVI
jgi:large subunit ribosomal protein L14